MNSKITRSSLLLFIITVASKAVAFFVTIVFSYYFGTDSVTDAYYAAGTIPNLINNSLTICVLTLFVPVYIKCRSEEGEKRADEFASNILNAFIIFNIVLFVVVCIASPILAKLAAPGFSEDGLLHTRRMIRLLSMSFPFTVAVYMLNNLCNANQKYLLPAVLTLINHLIVIALNIVLAPVFGIYSYPFICTLAWIIQLAILYIRSKGRLFKHQIGINIHDGYFKYMLKQSIPVTITTAADQINLAADNIICSDLPVGSLSCLGYAHRIFNSVNGIVTSTLLTIYYPIISRQYTEKDSDGLYRSLRRYFEIMLLLTLPIVFLLIGNSDYLTIILFNRGAMQLDVISEISMLFIIYVSGLIFMSLKEFATRLFYIIGDTKQPTVINFLCVAINICLSLTLKQFFGIYGIVVATTISTAMCAVIECVSLIRRTGGICLLKRHNILNTKGIIQIIVSNMSAMLSMMLVQAVISSGNNGGTIIISGIVYIFVLFAVLCMFKNEYTNMILGRLKK